MVTIQNADAALKDYYLDAVSTQLNEGVSPFFNAIEKTTVNVFGKEAKLSVVKGNMNNIIAGDEDGDLPSPYANRYYGIAMPLKNIYGTIEISDKAIRASRDSAGAFVNLLNSEMEGLVESAKANFSRMLFSDGDGYMATVTNVVSTTEYRVDNVKKYFEGMDVEFKNADAVVATGVKIASINYSNKVITLDKAVEAGKIVKNCTMNIPGINGREICGLAGIFDKTTLYGYNKQEDTFFAPESFSTSLASLSVDAVIEMIDTIEMNSGNKPNIVLCGHNVRRLLAGMLEDKRQLVNTTDLTAGATSLFINDVPVYADKFCPDNRIYVLNTDDFVLNQLCDWAWIEDEGGKILKQVPGKAAYSASLVKYAELICKKPCGQGLIKIS